MPNTEEDATRPYKRQRLNMDGGGAGDTDQPAGSSAVDAARTEPELSERLRKVMLCTVCLELPHPDDSYQCTLGHIVCEDCVTRLLAEAALNSRDAQCPHCRTHISWQELTKNLAVGQTLWELPKNCSDCEQQIEYKSLAKHLKTECTKRLVHCKYRCLGCIWQGCQEDSAQHEASCSNLQMSSDEILTALSTIDQLEQMAVQPLRQCHRQLSAQRISYEDLDLRWPQHTSRLNAELRFQSATIFVFEESWRLRVKLVLGATELRLSYSLKILSSPREILLVKYFATLPAIHVRAKQLMDVEPQLNQAYFNMPGQSSDFKLLPMSCPIATYRLLAMPRIKLRLWMMLN
ncbi:cysteine and histidine-rich protein 1 homolog [Drosophila hydei]|uniref:Cysteine and histidine-rich protein 1 homolog n=1 Tax=Drosophila hydei TaxID=7224 RepID=A0A6J1MN19_DROHY|nr:cysteine and histidine-rich protein 1 homolog [Drosophila hydei]